MAKKTEKAGRDDGRIWWRADPRCAAGGYWCATVGGRKRGLGGDRDAAEERLDELLQADVEGRAPRGPVTVADLYGEHVAHQHGRAEAGDIKPREFADVRRALDHFVAAVGEGALAAEVGPRQFTDYHRKLVATYGPDQVKKRVHAVRRMFEHAADLELVPHRANFGPEFRPSGSRQLAKAKARGRTVDRTPLRSRQVRELVRSADQPLRAMILLAVNCAFGNTDCGLLTLDKLHLRVERDADGKVTRATGHHDFRRPKNPLVDRRCPLWRSTVLALDEWLSLREKLLAEPTKGRNGKTRRSRVAAADRRLVFLTRECRAFVRETVARDANGKIAGVVTHDAISGRFAKLAAAAGVPSGFYRLRHTAITLMDQVGGGDVNACHRIRGHSLPGMSRVYVHRVESVRLRRVVRRMRARLFKRRAAPAAAGSSGPTGPVAAGGGGPASPGPLPAA